MTMPYEVEPGSLTESAQARSVDIDEFLLNERDALLSEIDQLHAAATTDELTQLKNRRGMREWAEEKYDSTRRYAMIVIDLADLGGINNTFGQSTGDDTLQLFASTLTQTLRTEDKEQTEQRRVAATADAVAVRIGGDEFIAIIDFDHINPNMYERAMRAVVGRIKAAFRAASAEHLPITTDLYIEPVYNQDNESFQDFFRRGHDHITVIKNALKEAKAREDLARLYHDQADSPSFE